MKSLNGLKSFVTALAFAGFLAGPALADDNENVDKSDVSKNPITGTVTAKREHKHKTPNTEYKSKSETKYKTDGTVKKNSEQESTQKPTE